MANSEPNYRAKSMYDDEKSAEYDARSPRRHRAEMALVEPALRRIKPGARALDAPCGAGRVAVRLNELGLRVTAADISLPMLQRAREKLSRDVTVADLEKLCFPDRCFDGVVCFRFFHHLPSEELRARIVGELCRVSQRLVVISFFHPVAPEMIKRTLQTKLLGKTRRRFAISPARLHSLFAPHGFQCVSLTGQAKYRHSLWLAVYERQT